MKIFFFYFRPILTHIKTFSQRLQANSEYKQVAQLSQRDRAAAMAKSGRLELGDNIYRIIGLFNHCEVDSKIRAITPFKVIQGHRGRYQSKARAISY